MFVLQGVVEETHRCKEFGTFLAVLVGFGGRDETIHGVVEENIDTKNPEKFSIHGVVEENIDSKNPENFSLLVVTERERAP